jgi:hypothetical protein
MTDKVATNDTRRAFIVTLHLMIRADVQAMTQFRRSRFVELRLLISVDGARRRSSVQPTHLAVQDIRIAREKIEFVEFVRDVGLLRPVASQEPLEERSPGATVSFSHWPFFCTARSFVSLNPSSTRFQSSVVGGGWRRTTKCEAARFGPLLCRGPVARHFE